MIDSMNKAFNFEELSAKLIAYIDPNTQGRILEHYCPGCDAMHIIDIEQPNHCGAIWQWDGNAERPTITPSVNYVGQCHYFPKGGILEFLGDCKHSLAGKNVELPDIPRDKHLFYFGK